MKISIEEFNTVKTRLETERNITSEQATQFLIKLGPKKLFKMGLLDRNGWREGVTKSSIEDRKLKNRKKNKASKKSKQKR